MTIKLIACDLDGTLIGPDLRFSPRLLGAVRQAQAQGITVTIATGRGFPSASAFARQLEIRAPLICYQGAQIKSAAGEVLYQSTLPRACLPEAVAFTRERSRELSVYCEDRIYQATRLRDQEFYDRWFGLPVHIANCLPDDLPGEAVKFIVTADSAEDGDRLEDELRALSAGRFQVVRSHPWFVEGLAQGVSKGEALSSLARRLGVARQETMALGDSGNDRAMIEWAGLGVAIGNASADVKAAADLVAPPQDEDGAAWAIERYALDSHS